MEASTYTAIIQTVTAAMIGIIGYLVKKTIDEFGKRIDKHDEILLSLVGDVQRLIGRSEYWTGSERRRNKERESTN